MRLWNITRLSEGSHHLLSTATEKQNIDCATEGDVCMIGSVGKSSGSRVIEQQAEKLIKQSREDLQALHYENSGNDWLILFVVSYILLHNLEMVIKRERNRARCLHAKVCSYYNGV